MLNTAACAKILRKWRDHSYVIRSKVEQFPGGYKMAVMRLNVIKTFTQLPPSALRLDASPGQSLGQVTSGAAGDRLVNFEVFSVCVF